MVEGLKGKEKGAVESMGAESATPPTRAEDKSPNPGSSDLGKPVSGDAQDAKGEATKEASEKSIFVNSEPMREDQVQNAVKFLSHPKVRGSPVIYRRSFLEKKGLTKEEIDEAFRRVPDPPPNVTSAPAATPNQDDQSKPSTSLQTQVPNQALQPAAVPTSGVSASPTLLQSRFHWSHAFLAVGLLAASGAGTAVLFKKAVVPRLKSWIRKVVIEEDDSGKRETSKPTLAEEAAAAAKAAAEAAAHVASASKEMLNSKTEEKKYFEAFMKVLDVQVEEMKSMGNALRRLEAAREITRSSDKHTEEYVQSASGNGPGNNASGRTSFTDQVNPRTAMVSKTVKVNGAMVNDSGSVRPSSSPASMESTVPPHPKSYMEIMAMIQRGEKPPGIKEIDDKPPNPNQPASNPRLAPRIKPWEVGQTQYSSNYVVQSEVRGDGSSFDRQDNGYSSLTNGKSVGSKGDESENLWLQKNVKITEIEPEIDDQRTVSYGTMASDDRPLRPRWVPPQPPSVAIPEAAAAIRQPKPLIQKEQSGDEQVKHTDNGNDEMLRITKESDTVVEVDTPDRVENFNQSDKQEDRADSIEVN